MHFPFRYVLEPELDGGRQCPDLYEGEVSHFHNYYLTRAVPSRTSDPVKPIVGLSVSCPSLSRKSTGPIFKLFDTTTFITSVPVSKVGVSIK